MSKKTDPKPKSEEAPAEKKTGNAEQRNKDDSTAPRDDGTKGETVSRLLELAYALAD